MKRHEITLALVETMPEQLDEGVLYVSERFKVAMHRCCCGCGSEVVTPLSPVEWRVRIHHGVASLIPSIGNWGLACQSHYWIRDGKILWARQMSASEIAWIKARDQRDKQAYVASLNTAKEAATVSDTAVPKSVTRRLLDLLKSWWMS